MNDINEKIYDLFEAIVNESVGPTSVDVTDEMLKRGSFVAKINIRKMRMHPTISQVEIVEFEPLTINWPPEWVDDQEALDSYDGEYWQVPPSKIAKPRPPTVLTEAPYVATFKNSTQARHIRLKLAKGEVVPKMARFFLKLKGPRKFDTQVRKIDAFLSR